MNRNKYFLAAAILILMLSVAITWAIAQDDNPTYYACVHKGLGSLRIVDFDDECWPYEYKIQWNMQGEPGPPGGQIGDYSFICGGCELGGIDLSWVNLSNSWLYRAYLTDANLEGTNFNSSNLQNAWFGTSNLAFADFSNANLTSANLLSIEGISSIIWFNTTCPDGTNSNAYDPETCEYNLNPWGPYPYPYPYPSPYPPPYPYPSPLQ